MGWLIALAILFLLAILPLGAFVRYDSDGVNLKIVAGPIRITILPQKKKKDKPKKEPAKRHDPTPEPESEPNPVPKEEKNVKPKGGSFLDFVPLVELALNFLNDFRRKLRVNRLELKLIMAGGDPCSLAINYGKAWAALGNLMPKLERFLVIKKRDIEIECDFTASSTTVYACLELTITLGRLIALAVGYGIRAVLEFLKIQKKRKGGAST